MARKVILPEYNIQNIISVLEIARFYNGYIMNTVSIIEMNSNRLDPISSPSLETHPTTQPTPLTHTHTHTMNIVILINNTIPPSKPNPYLGYLRTQKEIFWFRFQIKPVITLYISVGTRWLSGHLTLFYPIHSYTHAAWHRQYHYKQSGSNRMTRPAGKQYREGTSDRRQPQVRMRMRPITRHAL